MQGVLKKCFRLKAHLYFFILALILLPVLTFSQLCNGSLGDPVVFIDFGTGAGTTGTMPSAGYQYTSSSCPNDGYYTITSFTTACFSNAWHTVTADHTGNGTFMLVNASFQPSDFWVSTIKNLCPNTTYEFSAWIMNVLISPLGIKPNLTFTIETTSGAILNSFNTGDIPVSSQPAWVPYGFYFTTTSTLSSVVLRIKNNAPGGNGNDLALDDISFRPCGPQLISSITGHANSVSVCQENQTAYVFNTTASPGYTNPVYQWQVSTDSGRIWTDIPGANALTYTRAQTIAGNYRYRLSVAEDVNAGSSTCRVNSNLLVINVEGKPVINAGPGRVILEGGSTVLGATTNGPGLTLKWSPPDFLDNITVLNPKASPTRDIIYVLSATSPAGCFSSDEVMVKVVKDIYVPSAFTPNNDGKNDQWRIPFLDPEWGATVMLFNRYGALVYHTSGMVNWDGRIGGVQQPSGTYVYFIKFPGIPGVRKGMLQLIR